MFEHGRLRTPDDYFIGLSQRPEKSVYFYRVSGYNDEIRAFLLRYYNAARRNGVIIENGLPNPDGHSLAYYQEMMGFEFRLSREFIRGSLKKWLPRLDSLQRDNLVASMYDTLRGLQQAGKNDNMLRNAYTKFMCWLYYRFECVAGRLGREDLPKLLFEGELSQYALLLLSMLAHAGSDILLLQYSGDAAYLRFDPSSARSLPLELPNMGAFPTGFSLKVLRDSMKAVEETERLYGPKPQYANATNVWLEGKPFTDIRKAPAERGSDPKFFYNCFCRVSGVEDKPAYQRDLYQLQRDLKHSGRTPLILEGSIPVPTANEINAVRRKSYDQMSPMLRDLSAGIRAANVELQRLMVKAFLDVMLEESKRVGMNVSRLTGRAVYVLCWLKRYQAQLFPNWRMPNVGVFFYLGGCRNENEVLFCRVLARLPVDVFLLVPDLEHPCCLQDPLLYEVHNPLSLALTRFPSEDADIRMGTTAYYAERELNELLYQDSGLYRDQQYTKGNAVILRTMLEEIAILWDQDLKFRPNFSTENNVVTMPVLLAKVSGVKDGDTGAYWNSIRKLLTPDTLVVTAVPRIKHGAANPFKAYATEFFRNGRLQKAKIKAHPKYPFGFLREPVQEHLLDKLQLLIDRRLVKGTFENGTEYTIVAEALNLDKETLRMVQKFDFTQKNPKALFIITDESALSLEDTIYTAYLSLLGFDVVFFVPTGYQCVERHFKTGFVEEYQAGEYVYDLMVPNFRKQSSNQRFSLRGILFGRERGSSHGT